MKKGFTLIELLVVIAIIGILATIITAALGSARAKGRDARRIADIKVIQTALQLYYTDNNSFPTNIYNPSCTTYPADPTTCGLAPTYIAQVPVDPGSSVAQDTCKTSPKTTGCYIYVPQPVGKQASKQCNSGNPPTGYHLGALLEVSSAAPLGLGSLNTNDICRGYTVSADFWGKALDCSGTSDAGAGKYNCYDQRP